MGLTGATAEDAEAEYIKKICDHEIVTGETDKCFDIIQCRYHFNYLNYPKVI